MSLDHRSIALLTLIVMVLMIRSAAAQNDRAPAPHIQDPRMGVATHFAFFNRGWEDCEKILPLIRDAGFTWIRDDFTWSDVEKKKGVYEIPEKYLKWIKAAHQHGLKLILILNYGNAIYDDPYDPDAFAHFAAEMARQLENDVDCFEILNEPANFGYSKAYGGTWNGLEKDGSIAPWVGKYVTLCNRVARAIKDVNPKVKVIGLGSVPPVNFRQLAMGIDSAVDGFVDHPYSHKTVPEIIPYASSAGILSRDGIAVADERGTFTSLIEQYRKQSAKFHGPKEIWLTEWGYTTFQPTAPTLFAGFTANAQAKYTLRRLIECLGLGVDVSVIYDFKDDGVDPHDPEQNFGLIDTQLRPKPAYDAVRKLARLTADLRIDSSVKVNVFPSADRPDVWPIVWDKSKLASPGTIPTYVFVNHADHAVIALWSSERADGDLTDRVADLELITERVPERITCTDVLTNIRREVPFKRETGAVLIETFSVPDSPVFLTLE